MLCRSLRKTLEGFVGLMRLNNLDMRECETLEEFPSRLSNLCALKELNYLICQSKDTKRICCVYKSQEI